MSNLKLDEKEELFCFAYVYLEGFDAEKAIKTSGYCEATDDKLVKNNARKLLRDKDIKKRIGEIIKERDEIPIVDRHWWFTKAKKIVDENEKMPATQLKALEMIGKALGIFGDQPSKSGDTKDAATILQEALNRRKLSEVKTDIMSMVKTEVGE